MSLKKKDNHEFDLAAEDLRLAIRHLGAIVGKVDVEEILGSIFENFCIGKEEISLLVKYKIGNKLNL